MKGYNCLKNLFKPRGLALLFLIAVILSTLIPSPSFEGFEGNKELLLLHMMPY